MDFGPDLEWPSCYTQKWISCPLDCMQIISYQCGWTLLSRALLTNCPHCPRSNVISQTSARQHSLGLFDLDSEHNQLICKSLVDTQSWMLWDNRASGCLPNCISCWACHLRQKGKRGKKTNRRKQWDGFAQHDGVLHWIKQYTLSSSFVFMIVSHHQWYLNVWIRRHHPVQPWVIAMAIFGDHPSHTS